jgi:hypothetical protein
MTVDELQSHPADRVAMWLAFFDARQAYLDSFWNK